MGSAILRVAARGSRLSRLQTDEALAAVRPLLPAGTDVEVVFRDTPGDRDKKTALTEPDVPDDFFTRDLDEALLQGACDLAVHSAKDLPRRVPAGLAVAAILPCLDDRDALVFRGGTGRSDAVRVVGTSSARREDAVRERYPRATVRPARGTIEERLAALDRGEYDALVVAACALRRLGLAQRIGAYLAGAAAPLQGHLALVTRAGEEELLARLKPLDFRLRLFDEDKAIPRADAAAVKEDTTLFVGTNPERFERFGPLVHWPVIRLEPRPLAGRVAALEARLPNCAGVLFASPFAVRAFVHAVMHWRDARAVAGMTLLAVGPSTADALKRLGLEADAAPSDFGGIASLVRQVGAARAGRYLYPCSTEAPARRRAGELEAAGIFLDTCVFYENRPYNPGPLPNAPFARVLFTSTSAVRGYFAAYPGERAAARSWLALGPPTRDALTALGLKADVIHDPP